MFKKIKIELKIVSIQSERMSRCEEKIKLNLAIKFCRREHHKTFLKQRKAA